MTTPQPGLFIEQTPSHYHLEFILSDVVDVAEVKLAIGAAREATATLRGPNTVWAFGPKLWGTLAPDALPTDVRPFAGISGTEGLAAPATPRDIWFWCHGGEYDKVWATANAVAAALAPVANLVAEQPAFMGGDNRDPIGFIDGTENPALDEALEVSVVPEGNPGAGGCPVLIQKWVHNLPAFNELSVPEQEQVIGRTKADSTELDEADMPLTSHVSRNVLETPDGDELHIYRRNTPYATVAEVGTMFIGCAAETSRVLTMLDRMFGVSGDGLIDHLAKFSTPMSGSYYFAPAMEDLTAQFGPMGD